MRFRREWVGPIIPGGNSLSASFAVVSSYLLVTASETALAAGLSLPVPSAVELTSALPVPLALVMGPAALWAVPVGYVLGDLLSGAVGPGTVVGASVHLYLGYAAGKLLGRVDVGLMGASDLLPWEALCRFVLTSGVAALGAAAVGGWTSEIVRVAPFFVAAPLWFIELVALNLVCAVPLVGVFRSAGRAVESRFGVTWHRPPGRDERFRSRRVALVSLAWLLVGTAGSVGYRSLERLPSYLLAGRGLDWLSALVRPDLFGGGAGRLQVLLGAVMVSTLLASYLVGTPDGNEEGVRS